MPTIISLKNESAEPGKEKLDITMLLKQGGLDVECFQLLQYEIKDYIAEFPDCTQDDILQLAEDILSTYGGTVMPFEHIIIKY